MDIEDGIAWPVMGNGEYRLSGLHDLSNLGVAGRNHAGNTGAQHGLDDQISRRQLRLRRVEGSLRRAEGLFGLIVFLARGVSTGEQGLLAL
jgi:hypothetical protein